jgi:hypothetical protein
MDRPNLIWHRWAGLLAAAGILFLGHGTAADAAGTQARPLSGWIGLRPNLQMFSYLSDPYEDPVTHAVVRHLTFTVWNDGPVACGPTTTVLQLEVGDPGSPIGTAISLHPIATPALPAESGMVYHLSVPTGKFLRIDLWADHSNDVLETSEGDNYQVHIRPLLVMPLPILWVR